MDQNTREPLEGVNVKVWVNGQPDADLVTSNTGDCLIRLPRKEPSRFTVVARKTGFAASRVLLRHEAIPDQEIPRSYTLALHHATSVGGVVRDEEGRPIEGVGVGFSHSGPRTSREAFVLDEAKVKTDAQGRWRAEFIPAGLDLRELLLSFEHPKYLGQADAVNKNPIASPDRAARRNGTDHPAARISRLLAGWSTLANRPSRRGAGSPGQSIQRVIA